MFVIHDIQLHIPCQTCINELVDGIHENFKIVNPTTRFPVIKFPNKNHCKITHAKMRPTKWFPVLKVKQHE